MQPEPRCVQCFGAKSGASASPQPSSLTLIDLGVSANFQKNQKMNFISLISPQLRVQEKRTVARLKGLVLGFHFGQVSPCRRAPYRFSFSDIATSWLFRTSCDPGACSNSRILLGFFAQGLVVKGYVVGFFY